MLPILLWGLVPTLDMNISCHIFALTYLTQEGRDSVLGGLVQVLGNPKPNPKAAQHLGSLFLGLGFFSRL